jgi:hypothetical protein
MRCSMKRGAPFSRALELTGDAADILALQSLMNFLRHWSERLKRDRAVGLTLHLPFYQLARRFVARGLRYVCAGH